MRGGKGMYFTFSNAREAAQLKVSQIRSHAPILNIFPFTVLARNTKTVLVDLVNTRKITH